MSSKIISDEHTVVNGREGGVSKVYKMFEVKMDDPSFPPITLFNTLFGTNGSSTVVKKILDTLPLETVTSFMDDLYLKNRKKTHKTNNSIFEIIFRDFE